MQQEISKAHVSLGLADPTLGGVAAAAISDVAGSWSNEREQRFRSLPYDVQAYLAGHEVQRDRAVRRAQNEAAIARQKFMASERPQRETDGDPTHDLKGNAIDARLDA